MRRLLLCIAIGSAAMYAAQVGPDAVFQPGPDFMTSVHKACDSASDFGTCLAAEMSKVAPPLAVAFTKSIRNEGWMTAYRSTGRIDVASVTYPFRANENRGWLLVNGNPDRIDVDDQRKLPLKLMKDDSSWSHLLASKPKAALFPGDRFSLTDPVAIHRGNGAQLFIVNYRVKDGCHACEVLGYAFFGFNFDAKGKFQGADFLGFQTPANPNLVPPRPIPVHSSEKFELILPWDSQGEFDWSLVQPGADHIIRLTGNQNDSERHVQIWGFSVVGSGATQVVLKYSSRKSSDSTVLPLMIKAAPGLGR